MRKNIELSHFRASLNADSGDYSRELQSLRVKREDALMILHTLLILLPTSYPYKAGTGHAGFSAGQARDQSPSTKSRGVFGEWKRGEGNLLGHGQGCPTSLPRKIKAGVGLLRLASMS